MPNLCGITQFSIKKVVTSDNETLDDYDWQKLFNIDSKGNFTFLATEELYSHYMVYVGFGTDKVQSTADIHALNVTVTGFFSSNTNSAPFFLGVTGDSLEPMTLFIDHNYFDQEYKLPGTADFDGN